MRAERVVCLVGPTASGKTDLSLVLAQNIPRLELISADSMAVYKDLEIGTAKPRKEDRQAVPHHLVDFLDPAERWSAYDFFRAARSLIREIRQRQGLPLVVGGTGFYLQTLYQPLSPAGGSPDPRLRLVLNRFRTEQLYALLRSIDRSRSEQIGRSNRKRLIRALEIWYQTGTVPSYFSRTTSSRKSPFDVLLIGLCRDRNALRDRIVQRVNQMFMKGIVDEVAQLLDKGYRPDIPAFRNFTYAPVVQLIQEKMNVSEARTAIIRGTFDFLKRQNTWFRRQPVLWISGEGRCLQDIAEEIIHRMGWNQLFDNTMNQEV